MAVLVLFWVFYPGWAAAQPADSPAAPEVRDGGLLIPPDSGADRRDSASAPSLAPDEAWASPDIVAPHMAPRPLPRGTEQSARSPLAATPARSANAGLRSTAALGGVVGLILLLAWGYRIVAGRGGRLALRSTRPALIEVVSRTVLSPRQSLCLVRVGPRLVLLGVTPEAVRPLDVIQDADLTAQLMGWATQQRGDSHTAQFARCLEREAETYGTGEGQEETVVPEDRRLLDLKDRLAGTVARLRAAAAGV